MEFLYTDELSSMENEEIDHICSLLILADEFFIIRLKEICEYILSTTITLKNISQVFAFSNIYNAKWLTECCMEFICLNLSAVLEARCLDDLDENLLDALTEYYCNWNPVMQQRIITPYSTAPVDETVVEIAKNTPFLVSEADKENKVVKTLPKRKSRTHRNSMNSRFTDKELTHTEEELNLQFDMVEIVSEEENNQRLSDASARIQAITAATKQIKMEADADLNSADFVTLNNFPELGSPPSSNNSYLKSPKSNEKLDCRIKMHKLSQKQRKRLSSESSPKETSTAVPGTCIFFLIETKQVFFLDYINTSSTCLKSHLDPYARVCEKNNS